MEDAVAAVNTLKARNIPTIFLTNGGGQTERSVRIFLSKQLGKLKSMKQMFLAHTQMRYLNELKEKNVVVLGKGDAKAVLKSYGYTNVRTLDEFHTQHPCLFPDSVKSENGNENQGDSSEKAQEPVDAIVGIMNPAVWDRELQICCDILRSDIHVVIWLRNKKYQFTCHVLILNMSLV